MTTFNDLGLPELVLSAITELGYVNPTPIQEQVIPHLLNSKQDVIGFAQTGTGKTAAFGLPAIAMTEIDKAYPQTLILAPTRELCLQITADLKSYSKFIDGMNIVAVYGGSSIDMQVRSLNKGAHIVVATPGRAKDLINQRKLKLNQIERVVLDEADEMLSMGFQEDLDYILETTPKDKQTLLFSATMLGEMTRITKNYMHNPLKISVSKMNSGSDNVKHIFYMAHAKDRYEVLKRVVDMNPQIYAIVFCRTRQETKDVSNKLMHDGYNADVLHGELTQNMRDDVMNRFRKRHLQILVATDVAARGIDVNDLTHVINYNMPDDDEIYTHRSGRTGRAGNSGTSVVILHSRESRKIKDIERVSGITFTQERIPTGGEICQTQLYVLIDKIKSIEVDEHQIEPFLPLIYEKLEGLDREQLIKHFVSAEFSRFLAYYKNAKDINLGQDLSNNLASRKGSSSFTRLFINIGSRDKLNPARLIGLINEALESNDSEIGKIEILNNFSFFEIDEKLVEALMAALIGVPYGNVQLSLEISKEKKGGSRGGRSSGGGRESRGGYSGDRSGGGDRSNSGGDRRGGDRSGGGNRRSGGGDRGASNTGGRRSGGDSPRKSGNSGRGWTGGR